jgi:predicted transcriptional regulator of viral defense system
MKESHQKSSGRLFAIADRQQGFFTTKQAVAAGFSEKTHSYHIRVGNWAREHRGIYRLVQFSATERPDLMLWFLWSRNRHDIPQGVYSHETALALHNLSDVMPAKLHMTVPKTFRRSVAMPRVLLLHHAAIPPNAIEGIERVKVTKPLRTVIDLLSEGRVSEDIILQALRDGRQRGLITETLIKQATLPGKMRSHLQALLQRVSQ